MKTFNTKRLVFCSLFAALTVVGTYIRVPFATVPFTLQQLFTNLAGMLLGPVDGFLSISLYILMGLIGLPVFTQGGGIGYVLKPSFGYILGFAVGAYLSGRIAWKKEKPSLLRLLSASFVSLATVYLCGMLYFFIISKFYLGNSIGLWKLLYSCCLVFIPGDSVSCIAGAFLAKRLLKVLPKSNACAKINTR